MSLFISNTGLFAPDWYCVPPDTDVTININKKTHQITKTKSFLRETPFYASLKKKGSYTIEAAVILPLFLTLMVFGMFLFRVLQVQSGVQHAIDISSRVMAVTLGDVSNKGKSDKDVEPSEEDKNITGEISEKGLLIATVAMAGVEIKKEKVPLEFIDGGPIGFNFLKTNVDGNYIDVRVSYRMTFPLGLLGKYSFGVDQRARCRKWVGYDKDEFMTDSEYVYITEKGEVYHRNYHCPYINPVVRRVPKSQINDRRNKGGGTYDECKRCRGKQPEGFYYVTDYGTAFHNSIDCKEIKHEIKKVPLEDIKDKMPPCSKCGGGK